MQRQAQAQEEEKNWKDAASLYIQIGDFCKAVEIYGERGMVDDLKELTSTFDKKEVAGLSLAAQYFVKLGKNDQAVQMYTKLGDFENLVKLYVSTKSWEEALSLIKTKQELGNFVYVPYATWLAENDQYEKAQDMLIKAGKPESALKILEHLTHNAIMQDRFADASYCMWQLAIAHAGMLKNPPQKFSALDAKHFSLYQEFSLLSSIYFAYQFIHEYTVQPFTSLHPETIFNICRWLLNVMPEKTPYKVLRRNILYALAKMSQQLGAFKLARFAYEQLQHLRLPPEWIDAIDVGTMSIKAKPFTDNEDLLPMCFRCSVVNPLMSKHGISCSTCSHSFVYSFWSFDTLPLVEFKIDPSISSEKAKQLIEKEYTGNSLNSSMRRDHNVQTLNLDTTMEETDEFGKMLEAYEQGGVTDPIVCGEGCLEQMNKTEVFIVNPPSKLLPTRYFKLVVSETAVVMCPACGKFFHEEDYEIASLQRGHCPFCRAPSILTQQSK